MGLIKQMQLEKDEREYAGLLKKYEEAYPDMDPEAAMAMEEALEKDD